MLTVHLYYEITDVCVGISRPRKEDFLLIRRRLWEAPSPYRFLENGYQRNWDLKWDSALVEAWMSNYVDPLTATLASALLQDYHQRATDLLRLQESAALRRAHVVSVRALEDLNQRFTVDFEAFLA